MSQHSSEPNGPSADLLAHLRILHRKLGKWRGIAIVSIGIAMFALVGRSVDFADGGGSGANQVAIKSGEQVAIVELGGLILSSHYRDKVMRSLTESDSAQVRGLVVMVNSPGGAIGASERLLNQLNEFRKTDRPVVFIMRDVAASGAYIAAMGADRIFALENTITASIGAIAQWYQINELLNEYGIRAQRVTSGALKGGVDPTGAPNKRKVAEVQAMVDQIRDWFLNLVKDNRDLDESTIDFLSDGRVVRGAEGLKLGLVDDIGGEQAARDWLADEHDISGDMNWIHYQTVPPPDDWAFVRSSLSALGLPIASDIHTTVSGGGFWSIWEGGIGAR